MTWDEIYERADGAGYGEPELEAKDEARHQVACVMRDLGFPDPDEDEIPEERIEEFCDKYNITFDENGNIYESALDFSKMEFCKAESDYGKKIEAPTLDTDMEQSEEDTLELE